MMATILQHDWSTVIEVGRAAYALVILALIAGLLWRPMARCWRRCASGADKAMGLFGTMLFANLLLQVRSLSQVVPRYSDPWTALATWTLAVAGVLGLVWLPHLRGWYGRILRGWSLGTAYIPRDTSSQPFRTVWRGLHRL